MSLLSSRSPLAPEQFPKLPLIEGLSLYTAKACIKYPDRDDVLLIKFSPETKVAGVFTKSSTAAAPVEWSRSVAEKGRVRALLVNSGNANAFTGAQGAKDVIDTAQFAASFIKCNVNEVLVASTGVIGEPLPVANFEKAITSISAKDETAAWNDAAYAITTTDTFAKGCARKTRIGKEIINICGIAKGSGMIAPNMATMLAFVFTDANLSSDILNSIMADEIKSTFNCITVDSDTSTSDMALLFATGHAKNPHQYSPNSAELGDFRTALNEILTDLAIQVVCDGEGARKLITIDVLGAVSWNAAHCVAMSIANSPLVKTAIAGEDANWGRIVMAVGKSGIEIDPKNLSIFIGNTLITKNGERSLNYDEEKVSEYLKEDKISLKVDLSLGDSRARVWTCDLTHDYIKINAEYRS